ncbi:MAG TPA: hypothetical protein PKV41_05780, partial [Candidatus Omnitrophota bacterium]|nr:hypothetical protein [Candidatus Omnitrophota bacterium]
MQRTQPRQIIMISCPVKAIIIGRQVAAIIDETETILVIKKTVTQATKVHTSTGRIAARLIVNPMRAPKLVAIPLPPLNLRKTVQLCPQTTMTEKRTRCRVSVNPRISGK